MTANDGGAIDTTVTSSQPSAAGPCLPGRAVEQVVGAHPIEVNVFAAGERTGDDVYPPGLRIALPGRLQRVCGGSAGAKAVEGEGEEAAPVAAAGADHR